MGLINRSKIGVDLGATAVRVVELSGIDSSGYAIVRRAAIVPLPEGAMDAGEVKRPAIVGQAVAEAFRQAGLAKQGAVVGFGSKHCAVGRLNSPISAEDSERTGLIRNTNQDIAPTVPTDESALSWNIVGTDPHARPPSHVLNVAAALRSSIRPLQDVFRYAEVELRAVDLSAAALLRSVVRTRQNEERTISTVVDIGATSTVIATREGGHLRSVRTVALGGAQITQALASGLGIERELAEEQKRHMRVAERARSLDTSDLYVDDSNELAPHTTAEDILARSVDQLVDEIARSVNADARAHGRRQTQGIQLVGGGSKLPGLAERVRATVGVPCTRATAWADIDFSKRTARLLATRDADDLIEELTVAVGLAMWRVPQ